MGMPTEREPVTMDATLSVVPEMVPIKVAAILAPPLMLIADAMFCVVDTVYEPVLPILVPVIVVLAILLAALIVYEPALPGRVKKLRVCDAGDCDTLTVPVQVAGHGFAVRPETVASTTFVPLPETSVIPFASMAEPAVTVSVVPEIEPVTEADPSAEMVVPPATPSPEMAMPTESVHTVQLATVSVVLRPLVLPTTVAPTPRAVMVVPAATPVPERRMPTKSEPAKTFETVSVLEEIVPVTVAATRVPAFMGTAVATVDATLSAYVPTPPEAAPTNWRVCDDTVCDTLTVPVQVVGHGFGERPDTVAATTPVPLPEISVIPFASAAEPAVTVSVVTEMEPVTEAPPSAVMVVPAVTPAPVTGMPTASEPKETLLTVSVVEDIVPKNDAPARIPPVMEVADETTEGALTAYVPAPPFPEPSATMVELGVTPVPEISMPRDSAPPEVALITVSVPPAVMVVEGTVPDTLTAYVPAPPVL